MLLYKCVNCGKIFRFPSPVAGKRCSRCWERVVFLGKEQDVMKAGTRMKKADNEKLWKTILNIVKGGVLVWGLGGGVNILGKHLDREKIGRKDLFHFLFPTVIHGFQHPDEVKRFFSFDQRHSVGRQTPACMTRPETQQQIKQASQSPPQRSNEKSTEASREFIRDRLNRVLNSLGSKGDVADDPTALKWLKILSDHPRILILGAQGTGKSCLAFYLVEILRQRGRCYVYRLPEEGKSLIPVWLGICHELADVPPGCIVLVDEAYLPFFSRESQSKPNRQIAKIINLARQKEIGLIFVAHESRHLDKNILSGIDTLIIKKPAPLQVALDRSFLKPYLLKAERIFQGKSDISAKSSSYICFSPRGFEGRLENPKPSFWSEKLSHIFASGYRGEVERPARGLTKEEKKKRARKLRDTYGYSYGDVAKDTGVGKTTAYRWLNERGESGTKR